uniref:Uncharacterized protein n=2 Tax=Cacopsylla melanoneura TaxID=428564 RepID=A0A8D8LAT8_9HEMI
MYLPIIGCEVRVLRIGIGGDLHPPVWMQCWARLWYNLNRPPPSNPHKVAPLCSSRRRATTLLPLLLAPSWTPTSPSSLPPTPLLCTPPLGVSRWGHPPSPHRSW